MVHSIADLIVKVAKSPDVYEQLSRDAVASVMDDAAGHIAALSKLLGMLTRTWPISEGIVVRADDGVDPH
jgi:hypothetical protein